MAKQDGSKSSRVVGQNKGIHLLRRLLNNLYPVQVDKDYINIRSTSAHTYLLTEQEVLNMQFFKEVAAKAYQLDVVETWYDTIRNAGDGVSHDKPILYAPSWVQGIYYALEHEILSGDIMLGGIHTVYDTSDSEIITVGEAHSRGYTTNFVTGASDSDMFIVVHTLPTSALSDSNYGNDKATLSNSGKLVVQDGKVRYTHPVPALKFIIDGSDVTSALLSNAIITDTDGDYPKVTFTLNTGSGTVRPITGSGSVGNVPQNCCNQDGKPPVPPTPIPTPPPTIPTPPKPKGNIDVPIACSVIQSQNGVTFSFASNDIAFGAYSFDTETRIGTAIHDWIALNVPAFDFGCDKLNYITFKLNNTYVNDKIFGLINNPFHFGGAISPRLLNVIDISSTNKIVTPVYYFPVDKEIHGFLGPVDVLFNEYAQSIHDSEQKVTITSDLRSNGNVGYENLVFVEHVGDLALSTSVNPETLDVCGIGYTPHDYYFSWLFNGTDPIKTIGTGTFIYDQYEHGRISVGTGYFEDGRGFEIDTDAVHGFGLDIDTICNLKTNGSTFYIYGKIECIQNHWGGTSVSAHVQEGGTTVCNAAETKSFSISDGIVDFVFTCSFSYLAGHTYFPRIFSSSFPDDKFLIHSIHMFLV